MVVGVEGPAVVPDGAAGAESATQAVHDVLADDGAPRLQYAGDHGGVEVRDESFEGEGAEAHGHPGDRDVILVADGLAGQHASGRPLDPALPRPGIERVFFRPRPVPRCPGGRDHRRLGLLQPRLHEGIELSQLFQEVLPVEDDFLRAQVDPQFLGHRHDFIDVRDCVHGLLSLCWKVVATSSDSISRSDDGETGAILTRRSRLRVDGQTVPPVAAGGKSAVKPGHVPAFGTTSAHPPGIRGEALHTGSKNSISRTSTGPQRACG